MPGGGDRTARRSWRLLGRSNRDRQRLTVLRVVYRDQLGPADFGHRVRDRFVNAGIQARLGPDVPAVGLVKTAHIVGSCNDAPVERSGTLRVRDVEISVLHGFTARVAAVGGRARAAEARGKSAENGRCNKRTYASGRVGRLHGRLRIGWQD